MVGAPLTQENVVQMMIDCANALDGNYELAIGPRYLFVDPRAFRLMCSLNRRPPYAKRRGPRGRRLALKARR